MRLKFAEKLDGSDCLQFVVKAWDKLMTEGHWNRREFLIGAELSCIYATERKEIVGCLTFHADGDNEKSWVINIGYVVPKYRRKGVYKKLQAELERRAVEAGVTEIISIVKPTNLPIQEAKKRAGYTLHSLYFVKELSFV